MISTKSDLAFKQKIQIRVSTGSLPKFSGFIPLVSFSHCVKFCEKWSVACMRNDNKSPKMTHSAMAREEKSDPGPDHHQKLINTSDW